MLNEFPTNRMTPMDKVVEIMYINPLFNLVQDTKNFFLLQEKADRENEIGLTNRMKANIDNLNKLLSEDEAVKELDKNFDFTEVHNEIFKGTNFKVETNINATNIYRSLNISSYYEEKRVENIGDGKRKILSVMLKELSSNNEKKKIVLLEEPENHLYPQTQRSFSNLIESLSRSQVITTTHSPYYLTYNKEKEVIKLHKTTNQTIWNSSKISSAMIRDYGFLLDATFSEMLFYDTVLLVEGSSEKYFYSKLKLDDLTFNRYLTENNVGIYSVGGVDFNSSGRFLKKLGINVIIKTDNDIFKVPRKNPAEYRYAGIQRVFHLITQETKEKLGEILELDKEITYNDFQFKEERNQTIDENIDYISDLLKNDGIYLNTHQEGFERDFLEFIKCEDIINQLNFLQKKKLKNLHYLVKNENIKLSIDEENKDNVLVGFIND